MLEAYLKVLEEGYFEVTFAFEGLPDENVWKRPAEGLLSIGELAGHIAYWEAIRLAGAGGDGEESKPDLTRCRIQSPLIDHRFRYYPSILETPPSDQHRHLAMTAEQVCSELLRIHNEAVAPIKALNPDPESAAAGWPDHTYGEFLQYAAFHVAYHTGQMYSVRHLLGESTPDN